MEYNRDKLLVALYEAEGRTARAVEDDTQAPTPTTASHLQYCVEAEAEARNRLAELNRLETFLEEWHKKAHEKEILMKLIAELDAAGCPTEARGMLDPVDKEGNSDSPLANSLVRGRKLGLQNLRVGEEESDGFPYIMFLANSGWDSFVNITREMLRMQGLLSEALSEAHKVQYLCERLNDAKSHAGE